MRLQNDSICAIQLKEVVELKRTKFQSFILHLQLSKFKRSGNDGSVHRIPTYEEG